MERRFSLIDISSEDDCLLISSSPTLQCVENSIGSGCSKLCEASDWYKEENEIQCKGTLKPIHISESTEPNGIRRSTYNFRKSLAWNSAFFTNEGVLDAEELAMINTTFKKSKLPIVRDTPKSPKSCATQENDNRYLETIEVDKFGDTRAPIQRSQHDFQKEHYVRSSILKSGPIVAKSKSFGCKALNQGIVSQGRVKSISSTKRNVNHKDGAKKTVKESIVNRVASTAAKIEETKKSLKPNKTFSGSNSISTARYKRIPMGMTESRYLSCSTDNAGQKYKSIFFSKRIDSADSVCTTSNFPRNQVSRPTSSRPVKIISEPSSKTNSKSSISGHTTNKTLSKSSRQKVVSRNGVSLSIDTTMKTPSRTLQNRNSGNLTITSFVDSCHSSLDILSPLSPSPPSSTTVINHKLRNPNQIRDVMTPSIYSRISFGNDTSPELFKATPDKVNCETDLIKDINNSCNRSNHVQNLKPSGLRMPSPKIGFFDMKLSKSSSKYNADSTNQENNKEDIDLKFLRVGLDDVPKTSTLPHKKGDGNISDRSSPTTQMLDCTKCLKDYELGGNHLNLNIMNNSNNWEISSYLKDHVLGDDYQILSPAVLTSSISKVECTSIERTPLSVKNSRTGYDVEKRTPSMKKVRNSQGHEDSSLRNINENSTGKESKSSLSSQQQIFHYPRTWFVKPSKCH